MRIASWLTSSDSTDTSAMDGNSRPSRGGDVSSTTPYCRPHQDHFGHFRATSRSLIGEPAVTHRARVRKASQNPDLHVDGVDEYDRIDRVEGPTLPLGHTFQHLVDDGGDGLAGDLGAIYLGQMGLDFTGSQALRGQPDDHLVDAGQALLPLLDDLRLEGAVAVAGHADLHRPDISQHRLGAFTVTGVTTVLAHWIVLVIAEMTGDPTFQGALQQPLHELLEQPALAGQLQALGLGPAHQLIDQLAIHGPSQAHSSRAQQPQAQPRTHWPSTHPPRPGTTPNDSQSRCQARQGGPAPRRGCSGGVLLQACAGKSGWVAGAGRGKIQRVGIRPGGVGVTVQDARVGFDLTQDTGWIVQSHVLSSDCVRFVVA